MRVAALAGGTGAAKLLRGLAASLDSSALSVVVNTGDDAEVWGLHVSPDLDSVMYALAGVLDPGRGWGRADEAFRCLSAMAVYGAPTWFGLGDRDLATHLVRTRALHEGRTLSAVTADLAHALGVASRILPMSDEAVRTTIRTPDGRLGFQEYFVRDKGQVEVVGIDYDGAEGARPAPGVLEAIREADLVVVCPSNPVTSVGPILAVPGVAEALGATRASVVGVSPIVGGGRGQRPRRRPAARARAARLPPRHRARVRAVAPRAAHRARGRGVRAGAGRARRARRRHRRHDVGPRARGRPRPRRPGVEVDSLA